MSDTSPTPRRKTIAARLATAACVAACLAAIPLQTAGAEEPQKLASDADIEEMAGALGYTGSKDAGFWETLAQAVADQRAAAQEKADSEHAQQFQQAWADAAKYGRRLEVTTGRVTTFTEFIPPADGDIEQGEVLVRTGEEVANLDGTKTVFTKYWRYGDQVAVVVSNVDDDVETVTHVIAEPGSIDVKVGDERPVPAPGSSAAGLKPHTIDPKADGSLGRASGGLPDGGDKIEPAPAEETAGTRWWFDPIKLPDGRVITPFVEERPPTSLGDLASRTGYLIEHPDWGDAKAEITAYFDVEGKIAGITGAVIQGGTDTLVAVEEVTPGSLGLKNGDSRTRGDDLLKSNKPSAWEPKPQSNSGSTTTGGSQPTGGSTPQNGTDPKQDPDPASREPTKPDTSDDDAATAPAPSGSTTGGQTSTTSSGDSHPELHVPGRGPHVERRREHVRTRSTSAPRGVLSKRYDHAEGRVAVCTVSALLHGSKSCRLPVA